MTSQYRCPKRRNGKAEKRGDEVDIANRPEIRAGVGDARIGIAIAHGIKRERIAAVELRDAEKVEQRHRCAKYSDKDTVDPPVSAHKEKADDINTDRQRALIAADADHRFGKVR